MSPSKKSPKSITKALKEQWSLALLALSFLTRIPVKISVDVNADMLSKASRYFALIGVFIGTLCALCFLALSFVLPTHIAILLAMGFSLLLTGAFHEDGWADVWDGFGGGWKVTDKLNIMKDSRVGTYGASALIIILLLKYQTLSLLADVNPIYVIYALILSHTLSRALATSLIYNMPYVREDALTKVKPLAQNLSLKSLVILCFTGLLVLIFVITQSVMTIEQALYLLLFLYLLRLAIKAWFIRQLGGYTGDCLGAAQQLSEVFIYLVLVSWFSSSSAIKGSVITEALL